MRSLTVFFSIIAVLVVTLAHLQVDHAPKEARWCCVTEKEMLKCQDLAQAAISIMNFSHPMNVTCVRGQNVSNCMSRISRNEADLVTLYEADIYAAGRYYGLRPVVGEDYGNEAHTSYFVVALIRQDAHPSLTIGTLRNTITCHPRAGDTAGWVVPMGFLMNQHFLPRETCDTYVSAGKYFKKSCVPGAFSPEYDPQRNNPRNLCGACGNPYCPNSKAESYYGYNGSYSCLVERRAQVSFVKHTTVFEFTGINNDLNPGDDFKLLCPDGSRKDVGDYETCSLARIPAGVVMTHDTSKEACRVRGYRTYLLQLDQHLRDNRHVFQMFNSTPYGGVDVLFKDETLRFINVSHRNTTEKWLGERYKTILDTIESCGKDVKLAARSNGPVTEPHGWATFGIILCWFLQNRCRNIFGLL